MRAGDPGHYNGSVLPVRYHGSASRSTPGNGPFCGADGVIGYWNRGDQDFVGVCVFPAAQVLVFPVYFISGILDRHYCNAGGMFYICKKAVYPSAENSGDADSIDSLSEFYFIWR